MLGSPTQDDPVAGSRILRTDLVVQPVHHQPLTGPELDDELRHRSEVHDVDDGRLDRGIPVARDALGPESAELDPFGSDRDGQLPLVIGAAPGGLAPDAVDRQDPFAPTEVHHQELTFSPVHPKRQQVRDADESRHERRQRALVQLPRRCELFDGSGVHHRDRVGHRHRLFLVVRHVDEGGIRPGLDRFELELHLLPELLVECAQGLVQEQRRRAVHEGSRERDPLLLSARELTGSPVLHPVEPDGPQDLGHP